MIRFEACVEGVDGVVAAERGGADRVELCASLTEGGLSPSPGVVAGAVAAASIPVMCMVRPRGGDFCYTEAEFAAMLADVVAFCAAGVDGIVCGLLLPDGTIDAGRTARLVEAAGPLPVTVHRAFDMTRDPLAALDTLIALGVARVLTSGQEATAVEGAALIATLVARAAGRIAILPGSGLTPANVADFVATTGVREVHATAFAAAESAMAYRNERVYMGVPGLPEYSRQVTSAAEVARMVAALRALPDR